MSCDEMRDRIAAELTGELDARELAELHAHLAACPGCEAEARELAALWRDLGDAGPVPSARLRSRLERMLESEQAAAAGSGLATGTRGGRGSHPSRTRRRASTASRGRSVASGGRSAAWLAAAAALAVALGGGVYLGGTAASRRGEQEMRALRDEIRGLRTTVALALLAEPSASERLSGVAHGRELLGADPRVAEALLATFLDDPNVNLRLAALDALRERAASPEMGRRLIEAIPAQDSPLVQLSAIDALFDTGAADGARDEVARLAGDPALDAVVAGYLQDRLERTR